MSAKLSNPGSMFPADFADAFIFDIDGTLLNTRDLVHWNALASAMRKTYGIEGSIEGIPYHGMTDISILRAATHRAGVSAADFEKNLLQAIQIVCEEVRHSAHLIRAEVCTSVREVLEHLQTSGKLLGVASGNFSQVGWAKLTSCQLAQYFQFGCFSDRCGEHRPNIFRAAVQKVQAQLGVQAIVCFVGDTPSDIEAARLTGARIISVATGSFPRQKLLAHQPDICVECCGDFFFKAHVPPDQPSSVSASD
jgi:phosphoglycolate phosphatase